MAKCVYTDGNWTVTTDSGSLVEVFEGTLAGRRKARLFARSLPDSIETPSKISAKKKGTAGDKKKTKE